VVLNVGTGSLLGSASILSQTNPGGGQGGAVIIRGLQGADSAAESVTLSGGSSLKTEIFGASDGGQVAITSKSLTMDGTGTTINSSVSADLGLVDVGRGGDIVVSIQQARLLGGATITTKTISSQAGPSLTVQGLQGTDSKADSVALSGSGTGFISDSTGGTTRAGDVAVHAKLLTLADGAVIQAATVVTTAAGGNVLIEADSVGLSSGSRIASQASDSDAGQINISTNTFTLNNGSIATNTQGQGRAGNVMVNAGSMSLTNGATINSSSTGTGNAGNITINSTSTFLMQNSSVTTEASHASGGQVTITAPDMVRLLDSTISTSVAGAANDSNGGNISIDPDFVILKGSQILAQAFAGDGGAIDVTAGLFLADATSILDASSTLGVSGTVQINAPINNLSSVVGRLPESMLAVQTLLRAACAAKLAQGATSSFVERGRDGIPAGPDGWLASPYLPITSERSAQLRTKPSIGKPGIQLRRLLGHTMPSSVTLLSEHAACSS
jgi:large exoprotein involved in heme utilization and adhesion